MNECLYKIKGCPRPWWNWDPLNFLEFSDFLGFSWISWNFLIFLDFLEFLGIFWFSLTFPEFKPFFNILNFFDFQNWILTILDEYFLKFIFGYQIKFLWLTLMQNDSMAKLTNTIWLQLRFIWLIYLLWYNIVFNIITTILTWVNFEILKDPFFSIIWKFHLSHLTHDFAYRIFRLRHS